MASFFQLLAGLLAITFSVALADRHPINDFCVADNKSPVRVDGMVCKDPKLVQDDDFFHSGLHIPGNTSNQLGSKVTLVNILHIPGLNTLGISIVRIDYAPYGVNSLHTHRASEILTVLKGTLEVGFVSSNPENRLFSKVLKKGDVFVFPTGTIHFQRNLGRRPAVALAALNSQNPGVTTIGNALFGSKPKFNSDMMARAFQTDTKVISNLQSKF
ncbi:putative germin-like protein 2-1 [Cornus florida]|uniref:putative germin-like protein 2-1 n=1 Tax=Cornus florida TaxID=4283 RepID=UPI00289CD11C|nr:putative germin-like protein 2-1 [Cornus florida]